MTFILLIAAYLVLIIASPVALQEYTLTGMEKICIENKKMVEISIEDACVPADYQLAAELEYNILSNEIEACNFKFIKRMNFIIMNTRTLYNRIEKLAFNFTKETKCGVEILVTDWFYFALKNASIKINYEAESLSSLGDRIAMINAAEEGWSIISKIIDCKKMILFLSKIENLTVNGEFLGNENVYYFSNHKIYLVEGCRYHRIRISKMQDCNLKKLAVEYYLHPNAPSRIGFIDNRRIIESNDGTIDVNKRCNVSIGKNFTLAKQTLTINYNHHYNRFNIDLKKKESNISDSLSVGQKYKENRLNPKEFKQETFENQEQNILRRFKFDSYNLISNMTSELNEVMHTSFQIYLNSTLLNFFQNQMEEFNNLTVYNHIDYEKLFTSLRNSSLMILTVKKLKKFYEIRWLENETYLIISCSVVVIFILVIITIYRNKSAKRHEAMESTFRYNL